MPRYQTPNIYQMESYPISQGIEGELQTSLTAFIGYTERTENEEGKPITGIPTLVKNMSDYLATFGGQYKESFEIEYDQVLDQFRLKNAEQIRGSNLSKSPTYLMYQSIQHFFDNGGSECYVVSVGGYTGQITSSDFLSGIDKLTEIDEITIVCLPECQLLDNEDCMAVQNYTLGHCEKLKNRIAILDVHQSLGFSSSDLTQDTFKFRNAITNGLMYGAAYYPYIKTNYARSYDEANVIVNYELHQFELHPDYQGRWVNIHGQPLNEYGYQQASSFNGQLHGPQQAFIKISEDILVDSSGYRVISNGNQIERVAGERPYGIFKYLDQPDYYNNMGIKVTGKDSNQEPEDRLVIVDLPVISKECTASLQYLSNPKWNLASPIVYRRIKNLLDNNFLILPPSAAIAGAISTTDRKIGVWKAPANIPLENVIEPVVSIDNGEQEALNVDVISGKSINAIRYFVGKGSIIWGGRTLLGNDNEWRYLSVRRLFNHVETSLSQATRFAIFEPNTPFTWLKLKVMVENYLESLWRRGALIGSSPESAFFVNVGLGQTMTEADINNGIMNIEIGLAAVRPAEFIILTLSHNRLES